MRQKIFLFFVSMLASWQVQSQLLKSDLLADVRFLNEAIVNGHPVNYKRTEKLDIQALIHDAINDLPDTLSWRMYEKTVRNAVWEIGCAHTSITSSPVRTKEKNINGFFPLKVFTSGGRLFVRESYADSMLRFKKGDELLAVNGIKASAIVAEMSRYKSPDGRSVTFGREITNRNFAALFFLYFGAYESFRIDFVRDGKKQAEMIKGRGKSVLEGDEYAIAKPENAEILYSDAEAYFAILPGNNGYLRIETFRKKCKPFYRKIFRYLAENPVSNLVIDLRDNLGGSRTNVEVLLSYLVDAKTSYQIIRPKENMGKYLKGMNKLKFWSSFFYFDVKNIFHRSKTADGVAITYMIKPKKEIFRQRIYVLANGYSASSSTVAASYLKHHSYAVIIGEQTAGGEFWNNGGSYPTLVLPRSGIEIRTATYRFEYDFEGSSPSGILPDYKVEYDVNTYRSADLEMKQVMELMAK